MQGTRFIHYLIFFVSLFEDAKLVDIVLNVLVHTWYNGRCGNTRIAKRLDIFFMSEVLCDAMGRYRSCSYLLAFRITKL